MSQGFFCRPVSTFAQYRQAEGRYALDAVGCAPPLLAPCGSVEAGSFLDRGPSLPGFRTARCATGPFWDFDKGEFSPTFLVGMSTFAQRTPTEGVTLWGPLGVHRPPNPYGSA